MNPPGTLERQGIGRPVSVVVPVIGSIVPSVSRIPSEFQPAVPVRLLPAK
jgi:hypothetical protein